MSVHCVFGAISFQLFKGRRTLLVRNGTESKYCSIGTARIAKRILPADYWNSTELHDQNFSLKNSY